MRLHRFIGDFDLLKDEILISEHDFLHQLKNVFRMRAGDELVLSDGKGLDAQAVLLELGSGGARIEIKEREDSIPEPKVKASLYLAILKNENFEWAVEKAVECGVSKIIPIITDRTVKLGLRHDRLLRIAKEAAEQCGRGVVPEISLPIVFEEAVKDAVSKSQAFLFHTGNSLHEIHQTLGEDVALFIGPEGGWSEEEVALAESLGAHTTSLGVRILRAETAAAVATFWAVNMSK